MVLPACLQEDVINNKLKRRGRHDYSISFKM